MFAGDVAFCNFLCHFGTCKTELLGSTFYEVNQCLLEKEVQDVYCKSIQVIVITLPSVSLCLFNFYCAMYNFILIVCVIHG